MARWEPDAVDWMCDTWAHQWVGNFWRDPKTASEYIGRLSCTLGAVRIMADGAASGTVVDTHYPEVFIGEALLVSALSKTLTEQQRAWLWMHYVRRWYALRLVKGGREQQFEPVRLNRPMKQASVADEMGISERRYYDLRERVKTKLRMGAGLTEPLQSKAVA
jgi:hypothetical protein